ncbi:MAG: ArsA family ATPase, partial [Chloroflexi bacterium]|nr:ArsA family ATPase [Deltaproteobacteria bacterium]MBV9601013.1 ArsA family ATPase [Chloroflexota bacterium]
MRIILYTGKGGVGKTSIAAATAVKAAARGTRTVVLSTDLAHSLGDSLGISLGPEPQKVSSNLWAQETDIYYNLKTHWGAVQAWLSALLLWQGSADPLIADEITVLPGMDELANLLWINRHRESGQYDLVIVDAAPTGETLRLLSFPHTMRWWMEHVFPIHRRLMGAARPLLRPLIDVPLPEDRVYATLETLFANLERLHTMLTDPRLTTVRLVVNPEKMVVAEAQRAHTYFQLFGYPTDLVIVNRVLPVDITDPFFAKWKDSQETHLNRIHEAFHPLQIKNVPLFEDEVVGIGPLSRMGDVLFGADDPTSIFFQGQTHTFHQLRDGTYALAIPMPFLTSQDVRLSQTGEDLFVRAGQYRRHLILPRALASYHATRAKFDEERKTLRITLEKPSYQGIGG